MKTFITLFYDYAYTGKGLKVEEVVIGGPLDKVASKIRAGHVIEKIDGIAITESMDFYQLLNRKTGILTLLSMYCPDSSKRWEEIVKPMGGWRTLDGKFCENNQMEPDIRVPLEPSVMTGGRDQQIEAAVKELMK